MKNYVLSLLVLWLIFYLVPGRKVVAQNQFELSQASSSTTTTGPTTAAQTATLLENTSGTSFTTATPTTTVSFSLSNQQYNGTYGNLTTGLVYGATISSTNSASAASTAVFQSMNSVGGPANGSFTSSPCGPAGSGIDITANYGYRLFSSTKPLGAINAPTTGRYQYADITLTFNRAVTNPVLHVVGLGGSNGATQLLAAQYFTSELELLTTGVTLTELSGSTEFNVTADNKILNSAAQPNGTCGSGAACGSVRINGTGITSLTFRIYVRGVSGGLVGGLASSWDGGATGHSGDAFILGVSLDKAPVPTTTTLFNACPTTTADLTSIQPAGTTFEWHTVATNPSAVTRVSNPASVSAAGTYYLYSVPSAGCYSPASVPVTVGIQPCPACALIFNTDFEANQVATTFAIVNESQVPSWNTTASDGAIEVWRSGFNGVPSYSGNQFIELNANVASTLYQNFTAPGGSSYTLNFAHRGRSGPDVMNVSIGSPIASTVTSGTVVTGTIYNNLGNFTDGNTAWGYYTVTFTLPTGVGSNFSLRFNSISATGGSTSVGNFLDAISISDVAPILTSTTLVTTCPATTASLSSFTATNLPTGSTQTYHTGPVATDANRVSNITAVGSGIYYTSFFNPTKQCYGATTAITVTVAPCPAPNSGTVCAGAGGTAVTDVTANDLVNGVAATLGTSGNATLATVGTYPSGITLNTTTGAIDVATTTAAGSYTVVYQLCNKLTPVTCATTTVAITVSPSVTATLTSATICNGTSATLTATGGSSYRFSEGTINTTGILVVSPTTNGSNPYSVTVTSGQGCSAVASGTVTVNPSVTATLSSATICNGTSATLTATGGSNYRFSTGTTNTTGVLVVLPTTNGANPYSVTVTSAQGCSAVASGTVTVNPSVTATLSSTTICNGTSATLTATGGSSYRFSEGTTNTTGVLVVSPTTNGSNPYSVTVTSAQGCSAVASGTVTVNPSVTATLSSATICNGTSATLTASGAGVGGNYVLNPGSLTSTTGSFIVSPTTNGPNTYTVTATSQFGCTGTASGTVTVNPSVTATLSSATICNGTSATLTATGGSSYRFSEGTTNTTGILIVSPTSNGANPYSVTVTSAQGCSAVASGTVTVNPSVTATLSSATICNGTSATLTATGGSSYRFSEGTANATGILVVSPTTNGSNPYSVTVTSAQGCSAVASGTVTVNPSVTATLTSATICNGTSATLTATGGTNYRFSTGTTNTTGILVVSPTTNGSTPYSVTVTSAQGCSALATGTVTVNPSVTATLSSATICNGTSATLTATGGNSYAFSTGTTNTTGVLVVSPTVNGANPYSVTVTSGQGCSAVASGTVTVNPSVTATLSSATICNGTSTTLTATGGSSYRFSTGTTNTTGLLTVAPTVNGVNPYSVTVTSAQGCSAVASGTVTVNPSVTATLSSVTICNGTSATLTATGGTNYRFSEGTTNTTGILVVSPTTNGSTPYSVTVTSAQGCSAVASGTVTVNPSVTATLSVATICNGTSATLTAGGGTSYRFSEGTTNTTGILIVAPTTNGANPYSVTVTSAQGCTGVASGVVTVNPSVTATLSSATICTGTSATLTATGGTNYRFGPGQTNTTGVLVVAPTTIGSNPYSVTVTSAQGCTAVATGTVTVNPLPQPSISGSTSVCAGQPISLTANPTTGLTYAWSGPGGLTSTSNPLTIANSTSANSGAYQVVVTDVNGCTAAASQNVTVKPVPQVQILNTSITCANNMPAVVISTQVTGGTPPVSYAWYRSGAAGVISTSPNPAFSTADTYSVVVTDASGCVSNTATVVVAQPDPLAVNIQTANAQCFNGSGTITVTVSGGAGPYTVSYRNAGGPISSQPTSSTSTLQAVAGSYTIVVTDANGCSLTQTATLTQPTQLSLTLTGGGPVCAGQTTGTITSSVAGGTPSYTYIWSTGATTPNLTGLGGGSYSVVVTDANSCTTAGSITLPTNPLPATPTVDITQPTCVTVTGTITVLTPASGVQYSFDNGTSYQVSPSRAGLSPDVYQVRVRDNSTGCTSLPASVTVNPVPNPPVVSIAGTTTLCAGQPISLTASPTSDVTYAWSGPGGYTSTANPVIIPNSVPGQTGTYQVVVTDANGCTAVATINVLVNPLPVATLTASSTAVCFGQSINLVAGGGIGYAFSANVSGVSGNTASFTAGVGTASYSVTVTSGDGCTAVASTTVTVNPTPQLTINTVTLCAGNTATLTVSGCDGGTLNWATGDNTASLTIAPLVTTTYSATCTFPTGCSAAISTTVTVGGTPTYDVLPKVVVSNCTGLVANSDARIDLTTLQNAERADLSLGSTYTGPAYGAASNRTVTGGAVSFTGLPNPGSTQPYTIRLFSAGGTCFTDVTVLLDPADCQCPTPACAVVTVRKL